MRCALGSSVSILDAPTGVRRDHEQQTEHIGRIEVELRSQNQQGDLALFCVLMLFGVTPLLRLLARLPFELARRRFVLAVVDARDQRVSLARVADPFRKIMSWVREGRLVRRGIDEREHRRRPAARLRDIAHFG